MEEGKEKPAGEEGVKVSRKRLMGSQAMDGFRREALHGCSAMSTAHMMHTAQAMLSDILCV